MTQSIVIRGLGKAYRQYARPSDRLVEWMTLGLVPRHRLRWAVRDVDLVVGAGEAVGLVGANGAGKTTLLKLIAGTTRATTGDVSVAGRLAALLELGIGFHPEMTGRENALVAGQLLGYSGAEVEAHMPAIEQFAEIGDYLDLPIRTYSSGMQVRLAFSVATAIRPDILIVDEALSVGDAYFQHKSFARIREFKAAGTTILFVSHSAPIVRSICDRAVLIDGGLVLRDGEPDGVLDYYHALVAKRTEQYEVDELAGRGTRSGDRRAVIQRVEMLQEGSRAVALRSGKPARLRVELQAKQLLPDLTVGFLIRDALGNDIYGTNTHHLGRSQVDIAAGTALACEFDIASLALGVGHYSVSVALHSGMTHVSGNYDWWDRAYLFEVLPDATRYGAGVVALEVTGRVMSGEATTAAGSR